MHACSCWLNLQNNEEKKLKAVSVYMNPIFLDYIGYLLNLQIYQPPQNGQVSLGWCLANLLDATTTTDCETH